MRKYTQREIKALVREGYAIDITKSGAENAIREPVEKIGYSVGTYGINGGVLQGRETGNLYVITARASAGNGRPALTRQAGTKRREKERKS